MRISALLCSAILAAAIPVCASESPAAEFYVATNGRDTNSGSEASPFATIARARDAVRSLKSKGPLPAGGATVWIYGGTYHFTQSLDLGAEDSGAEGAPIVYRACEGEVVRITGGREVRGFKPVKDEAILSRINVLAQKHVLQLDLKSLGITDYGKMTARGFGRAMTPAGLELFFNDKPMTLARWPDAGWAKIASVPMGADGGKFAYQGDRPTHWAPDDDIWVHGYWKQDWADSYARVKSIDTQTREITTCEPHGVYGYKPGGRFYALNILEELDQPGEWYLDRKTGMLYFWPPSDVAKGKAFVSLLEQPLVTLKGASYVTLRGITLECTRNNAVWIEGGSHNLVAGCVMRNLGTYAVRTVGGIDNGVLSCDIYQTGDGGILLNGGDRQNLTPGGHFAENNRIWDFARWDYTYRPGVLIGGVGNRVAHNLIYDAPHSAVVFSGAEHVIEFNEVHHVCMDTSDAGGFYLGRDFTSIGNVIRYNYLHDLGTADVRAVYLDDNTSGVRVYGNVFYKAKMGVCIGGGRRNTIENNIFVQCNPSIMIDARGLNWARKCVETTMKQRLEEKNYKQPPYSTRYPELLDLYDDEPGAPKYDVVEHNISIGGPWIHYADPVCKELLTVKDNLVDADVGFVSGPDTLFRLKDDSPAFKIGFRRIPTDRIGTYVDQYRERLH